jgi:hypothetical protein
MFSKKKTGRASSNKRSNEFVSKPQETVLETQKQWLLMVTGRQDTWQFTLLFVGN